VFNPGDRKRLSNRDSASHTLSARPIGRPYRPAPKRCSSLLLLSTSFTRSTSARSPRIISRFGGHHLLQTWRETTVTRACALPAGAHAATNRTNETHKASTSTGAREIKHQHTRRKHHTVVPSRLRYTPEKKRVSQEPHRPPPPSVPPCDTDHPRHQ